MDLRVIGTVLVIFGFVTFVFGEIMKRLTYLKLLKLLGENKYEEYFMLLHSHLAMYLFPKYNREYMELNAYLTMGKNKKIIQQQFQKMLHMRTNSKQRKDLVLRAFNFYLENKEYSHTKELIEEIKKWDDSPYRTEAILNYEIFVLKNYHYIEQMEKNLSQQTGIERGYAEYLLSVQYKSKGDQKKSEEYLVQSRLHMLEETGV